MITVTNTANTPDAFPVVASLPPKSREKRRPEMRLLFAGYNNPCLLPKVLLKHVFIYLGPLKYQENLKTKVVQNLFLGGGIARCWRKYGKSLKNRSSYSKEPKNCDRFWFIHILSYRFNPIRGQLDTVLRFWLINVYMKECELIKGGHTFGVLAIKGYNNHTSWNENLNSCCKKL